MSIRFRWTLMAGTASVAGAALYLGAALATYRLGYPLDDAWIHQVYARNLGLHGEWAFVADEPSAGSTAPLWAAYLALGYLAGLPHQVWAYLGGGLLLALAGWLAARWLAVRVPDRARLAWVAAVLVPLEWHLAWAAFSGMETMAFAVLALLCCAMSGRERMPAMTLGALIGLGVWLRPEAVLLAVVPLGRLLLERLGTRPRARWPANLAQLAAGLLIPLAGYLAFQRVLAGEWWPNTFFAKQAEYAALRTIPVITRFLAQVGIPGEWLGAPELEPGGPLVGALIVLLPGLMLAVRQRLQRRDWIALLPLAWAGLHLLSYTVRLPVTYQHGRYAIPTIPVLLVISAEGLLSGLDFSDLRRRVWVLNRGWAAALAISAVLFWGLGAQAYARDVAIIESEMVETARWVERNTAPDARVAAHDIGALGYFAQRPLLDLAGLVSPEVIPILRDQAALADYLDRRQAEYLVTFPGWYPQLVRGRRPLYQGGASFSPAAGGENMAVYRWSASSFAP